MRLKLLLLAGLATLVCAPAASAASSAIAAPAKAPLKSLTFERVFASPSLDGPAPREVKLSPDGRFVSLLRNRSDDLERYDLWAFDRSSGQWRMLVDSLKVGSGAELSEAEKMQRERQRIGAFKGIVDYDWSADGKSILVPIDGDLYLAALDGSVKRLTATPESELNPKLSEKGGYVSFVRDQKLWTGPVGGDAKAITSGGGTVHYGEAEFVAQEEMGRSTGYWWSPNDDRIAVEWFDESNVGIVTRAAIGAEGTKTFDQRYPAAGTPNIVPHLIVIDPNGGNKVDVDLGADSDIYLARVDWAPDGRMLYVQRINREQTRLDMLAVDPATGKARVLFSETAAPKHWINLTDNYKFLDDGSLIWWSERDGFGHLYRFDNGQWTQLTKGPWVVTSLAGVDQQAGKVYFTGTKDSVLAPQVYSLDLAAPVTSQRISDPGFSNSAKMDKAGKTLTVSRSSPNQPPQSYIADGTGKRLAWIEENALKPGHPYYPYLPSHRETTFGTIKAADGTLLHWMMITPPIVKGKTYPVFYDHYSGPTGQEVEKVWHRGALPQAIVDQGFVYFALDNRGTPNRGVAFESPIWHAMGGVEVRDQLAGANYLKTLPFIDDERISTFGWSYGGYMTLKMLEANPGVYAAGIAVAPVTKWELYDTMYTERYMGDPRKVPQAYAKADAMADTAKIRDPLLIIHGMSDDNVVFENSSSIIAKMQSEAVPFEMMLYPGFTHRISGPKVSQHLYESIFRFLDRNGVPGGPR
jgi:dipeptidyl-peptidase-4